MKSISRSLVAGAAALALTTLAHPVRAQHAAHAAGPEPNSLKVAQASAAQRDLWLGHIFWARNVVLESLAGNTAAAAAADKQVVANAKQIAQSIEPFYGQAASDKLFQLLAGHYAAVKQYVEAGTDAKKQEAAIKALTDNAGEIATFLSGANPNLPRDAVLGMLAAHGGHHVTQIQQLRAKQYDAEAQTWEAMKGHMYALADTLAAAIAKQFPAKFS